MFHCVVVRYTIFCYVIFIAYTVYHIYCILLFEYVLDWMRLGYVFVVLQ